MRYEGKGPKFTKLSASKIRYRWSDVEEWLNSKVKTRTDD
jgi:predicted DNA-binding transcriptional regulator AlpA